MAIDASIYNLVGKGVRSVNDYDMDAQNLLGAKQQNALGAVNVQNALQSQTDQTALRNATSQFGTDSTANYGLLTKAGLAKPAADYLKSALDARETQSKIGLQGSQASEADAKTSASTLDAKIKANDFHMQQLGGLTSMDQVADWASDGVKSGVLGFKESAAGLKQFQDYAAAHGFEAAKAVALRGGMSATEQLKQQQAREIADQTNTTSLTNNAATNRTHLAGVAMTQAGENSRSAATLGKDYAVAGVNPDGSTNAGTDSIVDAIGQYKVAPPNGMALRNPRMQAILGQVTAKYPDFDATTYGARQQAAKAFSTGKDGQSIQSANTALNHLDTIEQLAAAQKNGNLPLFNQLANQFAAQTGNPAPTNLRAAISMVAPELTKAVVGTGGGVGERADFAHNLNPNGSPDQILGGVHTIQDLMGGRLTEAARTYQRTTGRKDFADTMLSPAAQKIYAAKNGSKAAVPADIQAILDKHGAATGSD